MAKKESSAPRAYTHPRSNNETTLQRPVGRMSVRGSCLPALQSVEYACAPISALNPGPTPLRGSLWPFACIVHRNVRLDIHRISCGLPKPERAGISTRRSAARAFSAERAMRAGGCRRVLRHALVIALLAGCVRLPSHCERCASVSTSNIIIRAAYCRRSDRYTWEQSGSKR